jgi:hypothetical protein
MDAARGASSQLGVVRIAATIFGMSPKDEKAYRLPPGTTRRDFVRIDIAKNNLAPVLPEPIWFKRESIKVNGRPDGESVGVLRPVTLDKKAPASSTIHLPTILAEIIATKLSREKHFKVSEVLASATPAQQAMFGDKKNRARLIADSFEGSDVSGCALRLRRLGHFPFAFSRGNQAPFRQLAGPSPSALVNRLLADQLSARESTDLLKKAMALRSRWKLASGRL